MLPSVVNEIAQLLDRLFLGDLSTLSAGRWLIDETSLHNTGEVADDRADDTDNDGCD